jgi:hypothetical protein
MTRFLPSRLASAWAAALSAATLGVSAATGQDFAPQDYTPGEEAFFAFQFEVDHDLLWTDLGASIVYADLERQALEACKLPPAVALGVSAYDRRCANDLIDKVVSRANSPKLTARHSAAAARP